jgi:crossover junction endodeoxyribonuclease RuvC
MNTAHAVGVLMLSAARRSLPVTQYTPSEAKKALTGNGRADKKQMTNMITRILGLAEPPKPADAADALALAVCHCWRAPFTAEAQALSQGNRDRQAQDTARSGRQ